MTNSQLDESPDLGFGAIVASESGRRLLNRDGTFNVRRHGLGPFRSLSLYHYLLNVSWPRFLGLRPRNTAEPRRQPLGDHGIAGRAPGLRPCRGSHLRQGLTARGRHHLQRYCRHRTLSGDQRLRVSYCEWEE